MEMFVCGLAMGLVFSMVFTMKKRWDLEDTIYEQREQLRRYKRHCKKLEKQNKALMAKEGNGFTWESENYYKKF